MHHICPECYEREIQPFIEAQQQGREFKPPPPEFDWMAFLEGQTHFSFAMGSLFFLIVLAAEGLHWLSGGKVPELIEWQLEKTVVHGHARKE